MTAQMRMGRPCVCVYVRVCGWISSDPWPLVLLSRLCRWSSAGRTARSASSERGSPTGRDSARSPVNTGSVSESVHMRVAISRVRACVMWPAVQGRSRYGGRKSICTAFCDRCISTGQIKRNYMYIICIYKYISLVLIHKVIQISYFFALQWAVLFLNTERFIFTEPAAMFLP